MNKSPTFPDLNFHAYFSGKVEAVGHMILYYPYKRIKNIKVIFTGKLNNNTFTLKEEYLEDTIKTIRIWTFKKGEDNKYLGYEKNVLNPIKLDIKKNNLEMRYKFKTGYKSFSFYVDVKDSMYLMNKKHLINKSIISKFSITIAETILLYNKL